MYSNYPNTNILLTNLKQIVDRECENYGVEQYKKMSFDDVCADMIKQGIDTHPNHKDFYQFMCSASNLWENIVENEGGLK